MKDKVRVIDGNYLYERFKSNGLKDEWVYRFIEEEPTVDAIPVEWLKLKIDTALNICPNGNEETEVLCKLLYEWEKENETR